MLQSLQVVLPLSRHIFPDTPHLYGYLHSQELWWLLHSSSLSQVSTKTFAREGVANADALQGRNSGEHLAGWTQERKGDTTHIPSVWQIARV